MATERSLYEKIDDLKIIDSKGNQPFVPKGDLKDLISNSWPTVKESLKQCSAAEIEKLKDFIRTKAMVVFAILVALEKEECIKKFHHEGFDDKMLPVGKYKKTIISLNAKESDAAKATSIIAATFKDGWSLQKINAFCDDIQWPFLAPTFRKGEFQYKFHPKTPMPFLNEGDSQSSGFSTVTKWSIHVNHLETDLGLATDEDKHYIVAVKTLREEVYGKRFNIAVKEEAEALEMLNASRNPHLVKTIAYFTQANVHSFIFPWAERGNLQQFWDDDDPPIKQRLQQGYLKGVFTQLHGLLSGINFLHGSGTRHTDLKPGNILCFAGTGSENNFGTLVITDVGIAKFHNIATAARVGPTDNRTVTAMYAAPESRPGTKIPTSRRYDIWSLGCIYLEFVVWLLGGTEELRRFRKGLFNRRTNEQSFYTTETPQGKESVAKVGQKVIDWMVALRNRCPDNTALHKLVDLIEDEMLVANVVVRSIPVYPIGPGAVRSAATFGLPETPNLSPKSTSNLQVPSATRRSSRNTIGASLANILRRPSRKSTQNDARPGLSGESKMPDRAYAIELLPKLQSILEDERAFKMPLFTAPFRGPSSFGQTLGEPSWIPADGNPNSSPGVGYPS